MDCPRLLFVCTANINRSPMAEGLLRDHLARRALLGEVSSAGLLKSGKPPSTHAVGVLAARGIDLTTHLSRTLSAELVAGADLVIGMERQHIRAASVLVEGSLDKSWTLKELLRRALDVGGRQPGEPIDAWLARLGASRDVDALMRDDPADDVADPVGGTRSDFERTAEELDLLVEGVRHFVFSTAL